MKTYFKFAVLILLATLVLACDKRDSYELEAYPTVLVDSAGYHQVVFQPAILGATIHGGFLTIRFGQSGCSDQFQSIELFDANAIGKSIPPQRYIRLSVPPTGLCGAYWVREASFNLRNLRINGTNTVLLNLEGYSQRLEYSY